MNTPALKLGLVPLSMLFGMLLGSPAKAQDNAAPAPTLHVDLALAALPTEGLVSLSGYRLHSLGSKHRLRLGYGLRYNGYFGADRSFIPAPTALQGVQGETLTPAFSQLNTIGLFVIPRFRISDSFEIGMNIDVVGLAFSAKTTADYTSEGDFPETQTVDSPSVSALLGDTNDLGFLKSEWHLGYWVNDQVNVRAGVSIAALEYRTEQPVESGNTRFRRKAILPFVSVSWTLGSQE